MTQTYQDRYYVNLILTVLFILGIGASLYYIYSLPMALRLSSGYEPRFLPVYVVTGLTFIVGATALIWALRYKKEVIVFRDNIIDAAAQKKEEAEQAGRTTINLDHVKNALSDDTSREGVNAALQAICKELDAGQGALYISKETSGKRIVELSGGYALNRGESSVISFEYGEGLVGQVASTGQTLFIDDVPEGYITIISGLGSSSPKHLLIVPVKGKDKLVGVIEIASFKRLSDDQRKFVEEAAQLMSEKIVRND
jgi:transcriptional regulator with GAF, ATPase, and Fis domain